MNGYILEQKSNESVDINDCGIRSTNECGCSKDGKTGIDVGEGTL